VASVSEMHTSINNNNTETAANRLHVSCHRWEFDLALLIFALRFKSDWRQIKKKKTDREHEKEK
jgi:hypothetical protein